MRRALSLFIAIVYPMSLYANTDGGASLQFENGAKWGTGQSVATICPTEEKDAKAAQDNKDYLANLSSEVRGIENKILDLRLKSSELRLKVGDSKTKMNFVLTFDAIAAIDEHRAQKRDLDDYKRNCPRSVSLSPGNLRGMGRFPAADLPRPSESADSDGEDLPAIVPESVNDSGVDIPKGFCQGGVNYWERLALDNGKVNSTICTYEGVNGVYVSKDTASEADQKICRDELAKFYQYRDQEAQLSAQIAQLQAQYDTKVAQLNRDNQLEKEGRLSLDSKDHVGTSSDQANLTQQLMTTGVSLVAALMQAGQNDDGDEGDDQDYPHHRRRRAPKVLPGGSNQFPGVVDVGSLDESDMPGDPLPTRYRAKVDHYYTGPDQDDYGTAPGGAGQGQFSCNDVGRNNATGMSGMMKLLGSLLGSMLNGGLGGKGGKGGRGRHGRGNGQRLGGPAVLAPHDSNGQLLPVYNPAVTDHYGNLIQLESDLGLIQNGGGIQMPNLGGGSSNPGPVPGVLPDVQM